MKNKLIDLNNHLFMQLERMNDEDLTKDEIKQEIGRSKAISSLASQVVQNAKLALDAEKMKLEYSRADLPEMIGIEHNA